MDELPESARRLLTLARSAEEPSADARDRVRRGVMIAIGASGAVAAGTAASHVSASSAAATKLGLVSSTSLKVALVVAAVASVGTVAWVQRPKPAADARHAAALSHAAPALNPMPAQEVPPLAATPAATPAAQPPRATSEALAPAATPVPAHEPVATPSVHRAAAHPAADQSLRAEMTLLHEASAALDRGDLAQTRALLAAHRTRFASGQLRLERQQLELLVGCSAHQAGSAAAADAYLRTAPDAVLAARIAEACMLEKTP